MRKKADQLNRIEERLGEIVDLLRLLTIRELSKSVPGVSATPATPYIPPLTPVDPTKPWQPPILPAVPDLGFTCPRCGMKFSGVANYVCQDPTCQTGLGPITC